MEEEEEVGLLPQISMEHQARSLTIVINCKAGKSNFLILIF